MQPLGKKEENLTENNYFFSRLNFPSQFLLKLGQSLSNKDDDKTWNTADWLTFFFFCHNKAGGVRGDTGGVSDPARPTEPCDSTPLWLAALICQRGKQELPVQSGRACKQKIWVGGWAWSLICTHTHTTYTLLRSNSRFGCVAQNAHMWLYSANCSFSLTGFGRKKT